jgi:hypothetical protein
MTKRTRGGTNWWEEGEPMPATQIETETVPEPTTERMPHLLQLRVFKRVAYLADLIEDRKRQRMKRDFYQSEMDGILWLLDKCGIHYERSETMGMEPQKLTLDPEPERPSAVALAMAKAQEDAVNAAPFLEEACRAKVSYTDEAAARRAIERIREEHPDYDLQHAYPCGVCKGWHTTSLDPERSDLAKKIVESRRQERPLPIQKQHEIVSLYRGGKSVEQIADQFRFPRRAVVNILNDAGYAIAIVQEEHRRNGLSR